MTPAPLNIDRWRRLEHLFHASLELPQEQRDAYLREACGPDHSLRVEVESLLANDFQEDHLIRIVDDATDRIFDEPSSAVALRSESDD